MAFDLSDYNDVAARLRDLEAKYPEGRVRVLDPDHPYRIEVIDGKTFISVVAACYRTPDDPAPATGMAWEPFPGKTNYTRDSELQNAETSAWGRAIVAALASTSKSIASAEDVRNRRADAEAPVAPAAARKGPPACVVCSEPITGKAVRGGGGFAHEECVSAPADAVAAF